MNTEAIVKRLDNRAGYQVVSYRDVGLPVFLAQATAYTMEHRGRSCMEEFTLRLLAAGPRDPAVVQGFLGLPSRAVDACLADLVRQEAVRVSGTGGLAITERGRTVLAQSETLVPAEQTIMFPYDGVIKKPKLFRTEDLMSPRDARDFGLPLVRAMPLKGPEVEDLAVSDVTEVVRLMTSDRRGERDVLRIRSIEKRLRKYIHAIAIVYKALDGEDMHVAFAIDGRLSREHEIAFAKGGGLDRQPIFDGLRVGSGPPRDELKAGLPPAIASLVDSAGSRAPVNAVVTASRSAADRAAVVVVTSKSEEQRAVAAEAEAVARRELQAAEAAALAALVRPLPVYEHPGLLRDALTTAKTRIHIVSPWIRRAVVDDNFIRELRQTCLRGVRVTIAFGISNDDAGERNHDAEARESLERLGRELKNLTVKRLGDTHAKILVKDSEFFVITSFNWLSFRGDSNAPFREEWGTIVRDPTQVEQFYQHLMSRFGV